MKKYGLLIFTLSLSFNGFAVSVKTCPATVQVSVSKLQITSNPKTVAQETFMEFDKEKSAAIKKVFRNLEKTRAVQRTYYLQEARNGRCVYKNVGEGDDQLKIEIYTSKGFDTLFLQSVIGPQGILLRTYARITKFQKDLLEVEGNGIALAIPRVGYTHYSAGGPLVFIGHAKVKAAAFDPCQTRVAGK
jgi:hypothetical protein